MSRGTTPLRRFEWLYDADPDPWGTASRPYERRKRQVTLACLPQQRYRHALDAGCGTGALTVELAARCDRLVAFDGVEVAVRRSQAATAGLSNVEVFEARLPHDLPEGPWDLLMFSEVLYYLDQTDLAMTLVRAESATEPGAELVAVDWRPPTPDAPRTADNAHAQLLDRAGWEIVVDHREPTFLLHVLRRQ